MHLVKEIVKVNPYELHLLFEDGNIHIVPLEKRLKEWSGNEESIFRDLLNPDYFNKVKLNKELETIFWDNGVDFCPDMLFQWSEK